MPDETRALTEAERKALADIARGTWPSSFQDERVRSRLIRIGLAVRQDDTPWGWSLTDAGRRALARATGGEDAGER